MAPRSTFVYVVADVGTSPWWSTTWVGSPGLSGVDCPFPPGTWPPSFAFPIPADFPSLVVIHWWSFPTASIADPRGTFAGLLLTVTVNWPAEGFLLWSFASLGSWPSGSIYRRGLSRT